MKKSTLITSSIVIGWLLIATSVAVFAASWQTGVLRGMRQNLNRQTQTAPMHTATQNRGPASSTHSGAFMSIAPSTLSDQEKTDIAFQYREESVARDTYENLYSLYKNQEFKNTAASEQMHMDAVKTLLDRYALPTPTGYGELQGTFDTLNTEWKKGLKEALEVGLKIEMLDITDIADTIKTTDNEDVKLVFSNIGGASYNHLRGFARQIGMNGFTTAVDFSTYLSAADVASKGSLKYKLTDRLAKGGVVVSNPAVSGSGSCQAGHMGGQMGKGNGGKMTKGTCGKSSNGTCGKMTNGTCGKSSNGTCGKTGMGNHGGPACGNSVK